MAVPICLRLLEQVMRAAASRTFWTAGSSRPMRMAMMAMTTSNSISVKPRRTLDRGMTALLRKTAENDGEPETGLGTWRVHGGAGGTNARERIHRAGHDATC